MFLLRCLSPALFLRFFLLFSTVFLTFQTSAQTQTGDAQTVVKLSKNAGTIAEILKEIQEKAAVKFSYSNEALPLQKRIKLKNTETTVEEMLQVIFAGTNITWLFRPDQILLFQKPDPKNNSSNLSEKSGKFTVSGYIRETGSREALIGATVYAPQYQAGLSSNTYGFYSITLPADSVELLFSYVGFKPKRLKINLSQDRNLDIDLQSDAFLNEVVITAEREALASRQVQMSQVEVPVNYVKDMPSLLGEKDVMRALQMMPGVQKSNEANVGLYVRGGGPDQNLIILDDATVYNSHHLLGFCSLFNGDALKNISLTKGGFPARFGGRVSSVVEMNMKEGSKDKFHGEGGIGLISSRFMLEGPIKKEKASFLVSARRTYLDLLVAPLLPDDQEIDYYFYDGTLKFNYDFSRKDKLYVSGYFGRDKFFLEQFFDLTRQDIKMHWGNVTTTTRWNHLFTDQLFANTSFVFSQYRFVVNQEYSSEDRNSQVRYFSGIQDFTFKTDLDFYASPRHNLKFGAVSTFHHFTPTALLAIDLSTDFSRKSNLKLYSQESAVYLEDYLELSPELVLNTGFRVSHFYTGGKHFLNPEPRFSAAYRPLPNLAVKGSFAVMNQYVHLLSSTGISLPIDLWIPATAKVAPQQALQAAIGIARDFEKPNITLEIEGYYKKMNRILTYRDGASFLSISEPTADESGLDWEDNLTSGQGWSYGAEFLLQKKTGRFTGWLGYTLSRTQHQFDDLNEGRKFNARFDRRHDVSLTGVFELTDKIKLTSNWVYGTGNAITLPVAIYQLPSHEPGMFGGDYGNDLLFGMETMEYGERNSYRMPPYHRLDFGVQFHKKLSWAERTWEISIYNVYNRKNPFYIFAAQRENQYGLRQQAFFGLLPSVSYNLKF